MSDANLNADTNAAPQNGGANGSAKLQFDVPFFNMQTIFGNLAEQGATRAQANFAQIKATSEEMTAALCDACSTNARRAADYRSKLIEISHVNTTSTLEFISQLVDARSFADLVDLSTAHSRRILETASAQNCELWDLAQKAATETAEPIKQSLNRVLRSAA
ncbi:phasin [Bradyrhizobium sp. GCM10027634]|uniref:phasin n=1 Tax=unclassified Bradyrhizobium TaxID=2631580 RepID=UPI00188CB2C1|nr:MULTISPECIES: phasin [unclassified Bradyrhizobium]MDN5005798.1 phasin [Bradyrhizobium sp. WYCCWR 12677]QOZ44435.1 phasin [Bradyrhizobium sp. CCBAU 53340]